MHTPNFKETREAYTELLEKIVEASLRMGLELDKRQLSALAMLLDGASYREIAQTFDISRGDAVDMTRDAVNELELFLDCLGSFEMMQEDADRKIERYKRQHQQEIQDLLDEIEYLKRELKSKGTSLSYMPIHHLPISPMLMSILFKAGYIKLDDVVREERDVLKALPGMTKDMMKTLDKFIELCGDDLIT